MVKVQRKEPRFSNLEKIPTAVVVEDKSPEDKKRLKALRKASKEQVEQDLADIGLTQEDPQFKDSVRDLEAGFPPRRAH